MRHGEMILKRIDFELYRIYTGSNEVTTNDCWERARALAWVMEKDMKGDQWLRDRYDMLREEWINGITKEMRDKIEESFNG